MGRCKTLGLALLALLLNLAPAYAQSSGEVPGEPTAEDLAFEAATQASLSGPRDISLQDQAVLWLKSGLKFIPRKEAADLLSAWGNSGNSQLIGLILPVNESENWTLLIEHVKEGHVSDAEAQSWNPDDLLEAIKQGSDQDNKDRAASGFPEIEVIGWKHPPTYHQATHQLVWALNSKDKGTTAPEETSINYNTYSLGRNGYFKFNLVTTAESFDQDEAIGQHVSANFGFRPGHRYEDFTLNSDKKADYTIAGLVSGASQANATMDESNSTWWDFIQSNANYFALACGLAAAAVFFSGRRKR